MAAETAAAPMEEIKREQPDVTPERKALVDKWQQEVSTTKRFRSADFSAMRKAARFARGYQWNDDQTSDKYVVNIVQRHIRQMVSALYAKNPKAVCRRTERREFVIWDGKQETIQAAKQSLMPPPPPQPGQPPMPMLPPPPPDPNTIALIQDYERGIQQGQMMDNIADTLEKLYQHEVNEMRPPFKKQMKSLVRRAKTKGVGFLRLGYERKLGKNPESVERVTDISQQITRIETLLADLKDKELEDNKTKLEELRLMMQSLQNEPEIVLHEGLTFDFPPPESILIDPECRELSTFLGAHWVGQEYILSGDQIKDIYKVDVSGLATPYISANENKVVEAAPDKPDRGITDATAKFSVVEIYDKDTMLCNVICEGYRDFLKEPYAPDPKLERFWPWFPLTFNEMESDNEKCSIYPESDPELMKSMQQDTNTSRQGLREQRKANRPKYGVADSALDEDDIAALKTHPENAVLILKGLQPGQSIDSLLQVIKMPPIDPARYDTSAYKDDVLTAVGSQEANLGPTSGATATETSIAEGSRMATISESVDELDDFLTDVAEAAGQVLLENFDRATVMRIVGPGAVWPELSRQEIADELYLETEASSSGRPNRAAELANFEKIAPVLLQIPGISPEWIAKEAIKRLDDRARIEEAYVQGGASLMQQTAQMPNAETQMNQQPTPQKKVGIPGAP